MHELPVNGYSDHMARVQPVITSRLYRWFNTEIYYKAIGRHILNYTNRYIIPLQIHIENNMNDRPETNYIDRR